MKSITMFAALIYFCFSVLLGSTSNPVFVKKVSIPSSKKKLTMMLYMAGDNNLGPYIDFNRSQCEREGVADDMNLLIFACTRRAGEGKIATKMIVKGHSTAIIEKIPGADSGNKETLKMALEWASRYPAEHSAVVLWDHGFNVKHMARYGMCHDNSTGHYLTDLDLREVFDIATREYFKKKIDVIGFDACFTAGIEIVSAMQPYATYMVASEQSILAGGWPYNLILRSFKQGKKNPEGFARSIVNAYKTYYSPLTQDYTLSLISLNHVQPVITQFKSIAIALTEALKKQKNGTIARAIKNALANTVHFANPRSQADIHDWYGHLIGYVDTMQLVDPNETDKLHQNLKRFLWVGRQYNVKCVIASVAGDPFSGTRGMHVYFPHYRFDTHYLKTYWSHLVPEWAFFLKEYGNL